MSELLSVTFNNKCDSNESETIEFITYSGFTEWFIKNRKNITILDIKER